MKNGAQTGILIFAHGSRVTAANRGVEELARQVQALGELQYVRAAFLEMAQPGLPAAVEQAVTAGCRRIVVIPYFLTMGVHLRRDLPALVSKQVKLHPGVEIRVGQSLEGHRLMPSLILDRILCATEKDPR